MASPYPLEWPEHWPKTKPHAQKRSRFERKSIHACWKGAQDELRRFGAKHVVISTNIEPLRPDGLPYSNATDPRDSGVAVYFHWRGQPYVVACDTYSHTWENLKAVARTIEAMRSIARHGASSLLERAVSGFSALPPAAGSKPSRPWWEVLGVPVGDDELINQKVLRAVIADHEHSMRPALLKLVETLYRDRTAKCHPDLGGSHEAMQEVNEAIESARAQLRKRETT